MDADIDSLLERYLILLDEYTKLRSSLSAAQADIYQNLARANFAAERGMRYGPDRFDGRMQATRRVQIEEANEDDGGGARFSVVSSLTNPAEPGPRPNSAVDGDEGGKVETAADEVGSKERNKKGDDDDDDADTGGEEMKGEGDQLQGSAGKGNSRGNSRDHDPLRWFGILTPMPLRLAQSQAVRAVEEAIPRLVSVGAEMGRVEIEVRRARKRRAKAAAAQQQQSPLPSATGEKRTAPTAIGDGLLSS